MFCPECGTRNQEDAVFCGNCGIKIIDNVHAEEIRLQQQKMPDPQVAVHDKREETSKREVPQINQEGRETGQVPKPKAVKRPMSTAKKVIIAEIILLLIVSFGFYKTGTENSSPESVAIEIARNINERDWNPLYDSLLLSKDKFISKEMFIRSIPPGEPVSARKYLVSDTEFSPDGNNARIWVDFMVESGEMRTLEFNMSKKDEKEFLIFDKWEVIPDFLVYDFEVQVPTGAKVSLGGTELDAGYQSLQNESETLYTIPALFSGEYEIKVQLEPMDDYITYVHSRDGIFSLKNMNLNEESQRILTKEAADVLKETYTAAFEKKKFNEISHLFTGEKSASAALSMALKLEYDELVKNLYLASSDNMKKLEISYLDAQTAHYTANGKTSLVVQMDFEGNYEEGENGDTFYGSADGVSIYIFEYSNKEWNITEHVLDINIYRRW